MKTHVYGQRYSEVREEVGGVGSELTPSTVAISVREMRWWLTVAARWEAKQHLGEGSRAFVCGRIQTASATSERWAFSPCVWLSLYDEAWQIQAPGDVPYYCVDDLPVDDNQAVVYACWVLGLDSRPAPEGVTDLHQDGLFDFVLGERAEWDDAILTRLLEIASSPGHPSRALATESLYQAACVGNERAIEALMLSAIDDGESGIDDGSSAQGAALSTLGDAAYAGNPRVVDALCWLARDRSYQYRPLAIWALGDVVEGDRSGAIVALKAIAVDPTDPHRDIAKRAFDRLMRLEASQ